MSEQPHLTVSNTTRTKYLVCSKFDFIPKEYCFRKTFFFCRIQFTISSFIVIRSSTESNVLYLFWQKQPWLILLILLCIYIMKLQMCPKAQKQCNNTNFLLLGVIEQHYGVVLMCIPLVGSDWGFAYSQAQIHIKSFIYLFNRDLNK